LHAFLTAKKHEAWKKYQSNRSKQDYSKKVSRLPELNSFRRAALAAAAKTIQDDGRTK